MTAPILTSIVTWPMLMLGFPWMTVGSVHSVRTLHVNSYPNMRLRWHFHFSPWRRPQLSQMPHLPNSASQHLVNLVMVILCYFHIFSHVFTYFHMFSHVLMKALAQLFAVLCSSLGSTSPRLFPPRKATPFLYIPQAVAKGPEAFSLGSEMQIQQLCIWQVWSQSVHQVWSVHCGCSPKLGDFRG